MCDDDPVTHPNDPQQPGNAFLPPSPGYPAPAGPPMPYSEPPLVQVGDITVTQSQVITPSGSFPVAGSQWTVVDNSRTTETVSQTGIILAIVGFFLVCALSLFFLLMKDRVTTGYIQVMVRGANGIQHFTMIPATSPATLYDISSRVGYAQSLAAQR